MARSTSDPKLNQSEWRAVSIGLQDVARCGCGDAPGKNSVLHWLRRILTGRNESAPLTDPRLEALRNFVCATQRRQRGADEYVPDLLEQGFNRRQVAAIALLSA